MRSFPAVIHRRAPHGPFLPIPEQETYLWERAAGSPVDTIIPYGATILSFTISDIALMTARVYIRRVDIRRSEENFVLTDYIDAALRHATYKILEDGSYWGEIPALPGLWGSGPTLEACREDLRDVVQDWLIFAFKRDRTIPVIDGIDLNTTAAV
jgi:predicted RNase H-like HicB family nuclease